MRPSKPLVRDRPRRVDEIAEHGAQDIVRQRKPPAQRSTSPNDGRVSPRHASGLRRVRSVSDNGCATTTSPGRARTHSNWAKSFRRICIFLGGPPFPAGLGLRAHVVEVSPRLQSVQRGRRPPARGRVALSTASRSSGITAARNDRGSRAAARHGDYAGRNGGGVATAFQSDGRELCSNIGEAVGSVRDSAPARQMSRAAGPDDGGYTQYRRGCRRGLPSLLRIQEDERHVSQRRPAPRLRAEDEVS